MEKNKIGSLKESPTTYTPFLKWAGGKRWLVENHIELINTSFTRLIEPFLGSGAVFFKLAPEKAILADSNIQLIDTYKAIRDNWQKVEEKLKYHHRFHDKNYYYKVRSQKPRSQSGKAAKFIYLNRTCWNGLYRVNLKGKFNVPIGTKSKVLLGSDNFEKVSKLLNNAEFYAADFESIINMATEGDLVFVDPPYTVKHNDNAFIKYNESLFSWDDQIRLRNCIRESKYRGAQIVITNAYHKCIRDLYKDIGKIHRLSRASVISGKGSARGIYKEMLIQCI